MWKKLTILLLFLILVSFVSADLNNGLVVYWNFTDTLKSATGYFNATTTGSPYYSVGKNGTAITTDFSLHSALDTVDQTSTGFPMAVTNANDFTWSGWMWSNGTPVITDRNIMDENTGPNHQYYGFQYDTADRIRMLVYCGGSCPGGTTNVGTYKNITKGVWVHVTFRAQSKNYTLWYNGQVVDSMIDSGGSQVSGSDYEQGATATGLNITWDEIGIWNRSLLDEEIMNLSKGLYFPFNSGGGGSPPAQGTLTINSNLVNTTNYNGNILNITYNGTIADTTNLFNCSLLNTSKVIETQLNKDLTSLQYFEVDVSNTENNFELWIYCNQTNEVNDTTTKHSYLVDNILPSLAFTTSFSNNSQHMKDSYLNIDYTWSDSNFLASNTTLFDTNRVTILNNTFFENASLGYDGTFSYVFTVSGFNYSIRFEAWDSHTGELLKYDAAKINDTVVEYNNVKIISDKKLIYTQELDKVSFTLDKTAKQLCYETTGKWKFIDDNYPNHYIDFDNKVWVDDYNNKLVLEKDNLLCAESILSLQVNSIGDLNYAEKTYFFDVVSLESIQLTQVLANQATFNEVLNMLGIVFIWAFINFAAFFLLSKGQYLTGWFVYGFASFFDLFLSGYLINLYQSIANPGTFYGLTASFLVVACSVWILLRVAIPFTYKTYSRR